MTLWADWTHITKVDPDKSLAEGDTFDDVAATGTDAIEVGGTTGMTEAKMERVVEACGAHDVPVFIEPSNLSAVVHNGRIDGYLIPTVLNAGDVAWVCEMHKEWARLDDDIDWDRTWTEAYIVLNDDSAVASYTDADCGLEADEVAAYAEVAENLFGQEIVYVEYSGTLGNPAMVSAATEAVDDATVFYGGGIHDYDSAHQMASVADTIVVGNLVHDEGVAAVRDTVEAARDAE
jgi:phosphoglycerol geranylgeranyltransferase